MTCINVREGDARAIIYALDGCGNPVPGVSSKLIIDTVAEIGWEDSVTDGDSVTERNFGGQKKYSSVGADELDYIGVTLAALGIIPALDSLLMGSATKTRSTETVGFGRLDLSSATAVAVEVLLELDQDACAEGATAAPIAGWLFPFVKNWKPDGGSTLNGADLVKPPYAGKGYKNANIFTQTLTDVDLAKWETVHDDGNEWFTFYLFEGASYSLPDADCELVELT